jgi:putative membrane protein
MSILKTSTLFVLLSAVAICACSKGAETSEQPGASQGNESPPAPATGTVPQTKLSDGQIANIVTTVDTAEIEQAQVALNKATDPGVRAFATQMVQEHTASKQAGAQLASQSGLTAADSPKSVELKAKGDKMLATLNETDAANFDATYVEGQIEQHAEVLKMLEEQLIPAVTLPALREQLTTARGMVQHHLNQAQQLKK